MVQTARALFLLFVRLAGIFGSASRSMWVSLPMSRGGYFGDGTLRWTLKMTSRGERRSAKVRSRGSAECRTRIAERRRLITPVQISRHHVCLVLTLGLLIHFHSHLYSMYSLGNLD